MPDERPGSCCWAAMTLKAPTLHLNRVSQGEGRPSSSLAHPNQLGLLGGIAKEIDHICLPICSAITEIGRVQSCFLVRVVRIRLPDLVKGGRRCKEWDCLRQERCCMFRRFLYDRSDVAVGIVPSGQSTGRHQAGLAKHLSLRLLL